MFYIFNLTLKSITNVLYIRKNLELQVEGEENFLEIYKWKDNKSIGMPSSVLIASYFVLHITPSIQPSGQPS